ARGELLAGVEARQLLAPALAQLTRPRTVPVGGRVRVLLPPRRDVLLPLALRVRAALAQRHVLVHALVDHERLLGVEAHYALGGLNLLFAQRRTVRLGRVDGVRGGVGDVRADRDERRSLR